MYGFCLVADHARLTFSFSPSRLSFLSTLRDLLSECSLGDVLLGSRVARAVLPDLTCLLATQADVRDDGNAQITSNKSKKGKKRARGYEGDEVFKISREVICSTHEAGETILAALEGEAPLCVSTNFFCSYYHTAVIRLLACGTPLSPSVQSIIARVLLAVYMGLPTIPPSLLSPDTALHAKVYATVQATCTELGSGTTSTLSKSLSLVIGASIHGPVASVRTQALSLLAHR